MTVIGSHAHPSLSGDLCTDSASISEEADLCMGNSLT